VYPQLRVGEHEGVEGSLLRLQGFDCRRMPSPQGATKEAARIVRNAGKHAPEGSVQDRATKGHAILTRQIVGDNHNLCMGFSHAPYFDASEHFSPGGSVTSHRAHISVVQPRKIRSITSNPARSFAVHVTPSFLPQMTCAVGHACAAAGIMFAKGVAAMFPGVLATD
jgi:hypothetical protein